LTFNTFISFSFPLAKYSKGSKGSQSKSSTKKVNHYIIQEEKSKQYII